MKIQEHHIKQFAYQKGYKYEDKKIISDGFVKISFTEDGGFYTASEINDKKVGREFLHFMSF